MQSKTTARRRARTSGIMLSVKRFLILIGAIVCFGLGLLIGETVRQWWAEMTTKANFTSPAAVPTGSAASSIVPTASPVQQESFLIILVDSVTAAQPMLEGVWLVTFDRGSTNYFLMGFDRQQYVDDQRTIADYFDYKSATDLQARKELTLYAIQQLNGNQPINFSIVVDRRWLANLIDAVGGTTVNGYELDGATFLASHGSVAVARVTLPIDYQQALIQGLAASLQLHPVSIETIKTFYDQHQTQYSLPNDLLIYALEATPLAENEFVVQLNGQ